MYVLKYMLQNCQHSNGKLYIPHSIGSCSTPSEYNMRIYVFNMTGSFGKCHIHWEVTRDRPVVLIYYLLCYAAVLKFLSFYAQYYAYVKELCLKFNCSIRVYSLASKNNLI